MAIDQRFDDFEGKLDAKLDARLATMQTDMLRTFGTWLFASQAAVIAVVALVAVFL